MFNNSTDFLDPELNLVSFEKESCLQVFADAAQRLHQRDAVLAELVLRPYSRQQQDLRRVERPGRHDHLLAGFEVEHLPGVGKILLTSFGPN